MPRSREVKTPQEMIAELRGVANDTRGLRAGNTASRIKETARLTVQFIDAQLPSVGGDGERYITLCEARIQAMDLAKLGRNVRKGKRKDLNGRVETIMRQCDSLIGSITHLTLLDPETGGDGSL